MAGTNNPKTFWHMSVNSLHHFSDGAVNTAVNAFDAPRYIALMLEEKTKKFHFQRELEGSSSTLAFIVIGGLEF